MTSRVSLCVTSTSYNCLGTLVIHLSRIFMSKIIWILPCFHMPIWRAMFSVQLLEIGKLLVLLRKHLKAVLHYANYLSFIFFKANNIWSKLFLEELNKPFDIWPFDLFLIWINLLKYLGPQFGLLGGGLCFLPSIQKPDSQCKIFTYLDSHVFPQLFP